MHFSGIFVDFFIDLEVGSNWKSFLGVVRFILTKYEPVSSHGHPVRAKSYITSGSWPT